MKIQDHINDIFTQKNYKKKQKNKNDLYMRNKYNNNPSPVFRKRREHTQTREKIDVRLQLLCERFRTKIYSPYSGQQKYVKAMSLSL
jgi:hypothetical protein